MKLQKAAPIYILLAVAWLLFAGWQASEHARFKRSAREALADRAREIGGTLGVVIRSQSRFGLVRQSRLEDALKELVSNDLKGVVLLNSAGSIVAQAGSTIGEVEGLLKRGSRYRGDMFVRYHGNLAEVAMMVDLGWTAQNDASTSTSAPIVVQENSLPEPFRFYDGRSRDGRGPDRGPGDREGRGPDRGPGSERDGRDFGRGPGPDREGRGPDHRHEGDFATSRTAGRPPGGQPLGRDGYGTRRTSETERMIVQMRGDDRSTAAQMSMRGPRPGEPPPPGRRGPPSFFRPWFDEGQMRELREKQGLHGCVLQISLADAQAKARYDLWVRITSLGIGLLAAAGLGFGWRSAAQMNRLQIRLLRASEMNVHLQELNIAAAGLAHETRNPLNIVRGLAQLIAQNPQTPPEIRQRAGEITGEVDRVTVRLKEFINYSRTPDPRPAPTNLLAVLGEVRRALESDMADKSIQFSTRGPDLTIEADEALLRQVLFNLLLNAFQSVGQGGRVEVAIQPGSYGEGSFSVCDDGPGVPPEMREEIFRPYVTTRAEGTGLGLAVVRQIVLAHHWEIECLPTETGAHFRISGLRVIGS